MDIAVPANAASRKSKRIRGIAFMRSSSGAAVLVPRRHGTDRATEPRQPGNEKMIYEKAALPGYLASTILFMAWPRPPAGQIVSQILTLLAFQALGIAAAMFLLFVTRRRARVEFDLSTRPRRERRPAKLTLVHSRE